MAVGTEESPRVSTKTPSASFRDPQNRGLGLWEVTGRERPGPWEQEVGSGMPGICLLFGGQSLEELDQNLAAVRQKGPALTHPGAWRPRDIQPRSASAASHKKLSAGWATSELGDLGQTLPNLGLCLLP